MKWYIKRHIMKLDGQLHLFKEKKPARDFSEHLERAEMGFKEEVKQMELAFKENS